jgi:hypothetical protein
MVSHLWTRGFVTVMDNSSYQSTKLEHIPTISWRMDDRLKWLNDHRCENNAETVKLELTQTVKTAKLCRLKPY